MQGEDGAHFGVARGDVLAWAVMMLASSASSICPSSRALRIIASTLPRFTGGPAGQCCPCLSARAGDVNAVVEAGEVVGQIAGAGDLLQLAHLFVRQRPVAGVLVQLVVELLEVQPRAGGGAFAAPSEGGNHGQHGAAAAIKNRALHLLVSPPHWPGALLCDRAFLDAEQDGGAMSFAA